MLGAGRGRQTVRGREKHAKFEFREKEREGERVEMQLVERSFCASLLWVSPSGTVYLQRYGACAILGQRGREEGK